MERDLLVRLLGARAPAVRLRLPAVPPAARRLLGRGARVGRPRLRAVARALLAHASGTCACRSGELSACTVGGLELACLEPLRRYRVRYADGALCALDLEYEGLFAPARGRHRRRTRPPRPALPRARLAPASRRAHRGRRLRDARPLLARARRPAQHARELQLRHLPAERGLPGRRALRRRQLPRSRPASCGATARSSALVGRHAPRGWRAATAIRSASRSRRSTRAGRTLSTRGRVVSRLANQATPGMFAWLSLTEWQLDGPALLRRGPGDLVAGPAGKRGVARAARRSRAKHQERPVARAAALSRRAVGQQRVADLRQRVAAGGDHHVLPASRAAAGSSSAWRCR